MKSQPARSPPKFFLLLFALSLPFYAAGASTSFQLLPGVPVSGLMFVCPAITAAILVYRETRMTGVIALMKRGFDYRRIRATIWYAPLLLLMPAVMALSYAIQRSREPLPAPQFSISTILGLSAAFFFSSLCEESGWSGYALDALQRRWNALQAGVLLGLVWAVWHIVPLIQAHRSPAWIGWWSLSTVAARVLMVWLYNNMGATVFAATIFHAMIDLTWQLFPLNGSYYDPRVTGLIMAALAIMVAFAWGPRELGRQQE